MWILLVILSLLLAPLEVFHIRPMNPMVEICDNAIDDDGDGAIDLNDSDCTCQISVPISLIPNPSFEEMSCCPQNRGGLDCADTWIQASQATTDYLHQCGWFGWEDLPVPLPLPDGNACIGFRNGRFGDDPNPNWKEYTGACLTSPLRAGASYKFQFWLGFTNYESSPPINVVFYGSPDCENLPFGANDDQFGCPLNGPGWIQLDQIYASGSNNWTLQEFNVTPLTDIYAISIGPDCRQNTHSTNPYYFLDNLVLADLKEFGLVIAPNGHPCDPNFSLSLPDRAGIKYQWYRNGIAVVGETGREIKANLEGSYQVLVEEQGQVACKVTKAYVHNVPEIRNRINHNLCSGDVYQYNGRSISGSGIYRDTFKTIDLCDSIVEFDARIVEDVEVTLDAKIFAGETLAIGDHRFTSPTRERVTIVSSLGCDSIIDLNLEYYKVFVPNAFSPNGDGINDQFSIYGDLTELISVKSLAIYNKWGSRVLYLEDLNPNDDSPSSSFHEQAEGVYTYAAQLLMNDGKLHLKAGSVMLIR